MSPKHFFYPDTAPGTSNLHSHTGYEAITVTPNFPGKPDCQEVFLGISMDWSGTKPGEAWAAVDADELRDALDKAVGPREEPEPWEGRKPYRPIDRDRLLRHIEDIEGALTRRNARHEEDQETIRELEATITGLRIIIEGLEAEAAKPSREEQLELLDQVGPGKEVVLDAPRLLDTPEARAKAIPALEIVRVTSYIKQDGSQGFRLYVANDDFGWHGRSEEALALGLAAEDFKPAAELRRKEYEDAGLAEWEIELLLSHYRS